MTNAELLVLCERARQDWQDADGDDVLDAGLAEEYLPVFGQEIVRLVRENEALAEQAKGMRLAWDIHMAASHRHESP